MEIIADLFSEIGDLADITPVNGLVTSIQDQSYRYPIPDINTFIGSRWGMHGTTSGMAVVTELMSQ